MKPRALSLILVAAGAFALGAWVFRAPPLAREPTAVAVAASPAIAPRAIEAKTKLAPSPEEARQTLAALAETDPARAIDLAQELGRTEREKAAWVTNAMQQWADRDPVAAWQWLRGLANERMQELAGGELGGVVLGAMARRDPHLVVAQLDTLLRNGNTSDAISTPVAVQLGLTALAQQGQATLAQATVEAWARDPAKLPLEAAAYESVAMALAKTQPRETGEWLRALPPTDERDAAFAGFAATWAKRDPRAALAWAETLPADAGQQAALRRTVSDWIEEFPDQISSWLGDYLTRVPPSASSDALVETVINNSPVLRAAPSSALQWTNLIADPARRIDAHERIALRWSEQDAAAAIEFVTRSTVIPAGRKTAVVQQIQLAHAAGKPTD